MFRQLTLLMLLALVLVASSSSATTVHVPGDQPTIQAGIDAAVTGDIVLVAPGTYTGPGNRDISFGGKGITLESESGAELTIIDCELSDRAFRFVSGENSSAVLRGFTIENGTATSGGGILCTNGSSPLIENCSVTGCIATEVEPFSGGGAIRCYGSSPILNNITLKGNTAERGGGVCCVLDANPILTDVTFIENIAVAGGGVYARQGSTPSVTDCEFTDNVVARSGGAIFCDDVNPTITGCVFTSNSAEGGGANYGGGAIYAYKSGVVVSECVFDGNTAAIRGGGVVTREYASATLTNLTFYGGGAPEGAHIYSRDSSPTISKVILSFADEGAAIVCDAGGAPSLHNSCIYGNVGGDSLCGFYGNNVFSDPLFCDAAVGDFTLHETSPCSPGNSMCGELIGALPVACGVSAAQTISWGRVKAKYK